MDAVLIFAAQCRQCSGPDGHCAAGCIIAAAEQLGYMQPQQVQHGCRPTKILALCAVAAHIAVCRLAASSQCP